MGCKGVFRGAGGLGAKTSVNVTVVVPNSCGSFSQRLKFALSLNIGEGFSLQFFLALHVL